MGKYTSSSRKPVTPKSEGPHAIWRGIGCLMILIIPVISIAAGYQTITYGLAHNWSIPYQLLGIPVLPKLFYKSSGLITIFGPITYVQNFYAIAAVSFLYMVMIGGVISVIYAAVYRYTGPARYGPTDAPPPKIKTKRYTR